MTNRAHCSRCGASVTEDADAQLHLAGCRGYQGWRSYETWAVALWIDNEEGSYHYWRDAARDCAREAHRSKRSASELLADRLEEEFEDAVRERLGDRCDVFGDLMNSALSEVGWIDIAKHLSQD
jgi:hypothetical protein